MTRTRPRKTPQRYGWVLKLSPSADQLSEEGDRGFDFLSDLALYAEDRRRGALTGKLPEPVTVETIAAKEGLSPQKIRSLMRRARIELFGKDLSDSAIYRRLRRAEGLASRGERPCAEPGCPRPLPSRATARRRYCDHHVSGHARIRRFRERKAAAAAPPGQRARRP